MRRLVAGLVVLGIVGACTAAEPENTTRVVRVVMADDWAAAPVFRDTVNAFEATNERVEVRVQAAPFSQVPDLVRNAADLGQPFDLAHWHAFSAASAGLALVLDESWAEAGLTADEYLPGAVDDVTWDGQRYGVPLDVNALVLLVNRRLLGEAGLTPDDLADTGRILEVARRIVDSGVSDHAVTASVSTWVAYGWIRAHGGRLIQPDQEGEITFTFDDPAAIVALDTLGALTAEGLTTPPFAQDQAIDTVQYFTSGAAALHATGSWDLAVAGRSLAVEEDDILVLPLPRGEGDTGTVLGGSSLFIPVGAQQPDLAFALALALTADDVALRLAEEEGRLPARPRVYSASSQFEERAALATVVAELPQAEILPLYAYPELLEGFRNAIELVLRGQQDAAGALGALQQRAEQLTVEAGHP